MIDFTPARGTVAVGGLVTLTPSVTVEVTSGAVGAGNRAFVALDAAIESGWLTTSSRAGGVCRRVPTCPTICAVRTESPITRFVDVIRTLFPGTVVTTNTGVIVLTVSPALSMPNTLIGVTTPMLSRSVSPNATAGDGRMTGVM